MQARSLLSLPAAEGLGPALRPVPRPPLLALCPRRLGTCSVRAVSWVALLWLSLLCTGSTRSMFSKWLGGGEPLPDPTIQVLGPSPCGEWITWRSLVRHGERGFGPEAGGRPNPVVGGTHTHRCSESWGRVPGPSEDLQSSQEYPCPRGSVTIAIEKHHSRPREWLWKQNKWCILISSVVRFLLWTRGLAFSFCTWPCKLCSWLWLQPRKFGVTNLSTARQPTPCVSLVSCLSFLHKGYTVFTVPQCMRGHLFLKRKRNRSLQMKISSWS